MAMIRITREKKRKARMNVDVRVEKKMMKKKRMKKKKTKKMRKKKKKRCDSQDRKSRMNEDTKES